MNRKSWDVLFALSLVAVAAFAALLLLSKPTRKEGSVRGTKTLTEVALKAKIDSERAHSIIAKLRCEGNSQTLASAELAYFTKAAQGLRLQLLEFRSEKEKRAGEVDEVPSTLMVQGSFMNVMSLLGQIEASNSRYMVRRLEITQTGKGDQVSAAFGLAAFVEKEAL